MCLLFAYERMYVSTCVRTTMYVRMYVYMYVRMYVCTYASMYVCTHVDVCLYFRSLKNLSSVRTSVCPFVFFEVTEIQTNKQTNNTPVFLPERTTSGENVFDTVNRSS